MRSSMTRRVSWGVLLLSTTSLNFVVRPSLKAQEPTLAPSTTAKPVETLPAPAIKSGPALRVPSRALPSTLPPGAVPPEVFLSPGETPPTVTVPGANVPSVVSGTPVTIEPASDALPHELAPGILIVPLSPRKVAGYSAEGGGWKGYEAPERMRVAPVAGEKIVAFASLAPEVTEVVCFSGPRGDFHRHGIPRSPGPVEPIVTSCMAWYQVPEGIIAYSALTNSWSDLPLRGGGLECELHHNDTLLTVINDGKMHAFSAKTGRWDSVDLRQR